MYPLADRDASRLLIYNNGAILEDLYRNLDQHLPPGALLIFNDTKVIEARLLFEKATGAVIEIFCLEPDEQYPDITTALSQQGQVIWKCLIGGASKWKQGHVLEKKILQTNNEIMLSAKYVKKNTDTFNIHLSWTPAHFSFAEILHFSGAIPLPPYIKRDAEKTDLDRYQTIFAQKDGSVAAPTAGLHFTHTIFEKLKNKNVKHDFITLHVGAGTFIPVKSEKLEDHIMHYEWIDVSKTTIENILHNPEQPVIAVGTTSLRTIESLYWLGVKQIISGSEQIPELLQWEVYDLADAGIPVQEALQFLLSSMGKNKLFRLLTRTQLMIAPNYKPRIARGLITNFHLPQSTLLLLVAAITGDDPKTGQPGWRKIYEYALQHDFRFLSYGDGSLLWIMH